MSSSALKLRKGFQQTVSKAKTNIDNQPLESTRRHIDQYKTVYLMTKNKIAADNRDFIPIIGTSGFEWL